MASYLSHDQIPLEMWITMITHKYPDLADQLHEIELTSHQAPQQIRRTLQDYEMYLANGRLKPKALCS